MGQRIVKQEINEAVKLYNAQDHEEAVKKWNHVLRKTSNCQLKFQTLGHLANASSDLGKYRDMLVYAIQQIDIANERENTYMRAEAYLNLARGNERIGEYHKAVSYARHSLQNQAKDPRTHGHVYLTMSNAYFGFSNFSKCLENLDNALRVANEHGDIVLRIETYFSVARFFTTLKDYNKAVQFLDKCKELSVSIEVPDLVQKYLRLTSVHLSIPYRELGHYNEAMEKCEDALKSAMEKNDRPVQAKCLHSFAEIHKKLHDFEKAYPRYEAALNIMVETGDRYGQMEVLIGRADAMMLGNNVKKSLELYGKALEMAQALRCKYQVYHIHRVLEGIYEQQGDFDAAYQEKLCYTPMIDELEVRCEVCEKMMGIVPEPLDTLLCNHLFHAKCANFLRKREELDPRRPSQILCPRCRINSCKTDQATPS
ncbi:43 kDa receptor-associated protein of the synapse [Lingula anatina]|uniref:43 kDa receptor-associated protein of the synapse n=1 Tax=Lingula anatina TaxID=7574 RepID=A0A1S3H1K5_LINAN|nr:43 kDa receptor-associated protein of the synapse [Lingula anatina]|eukprot:XP_013380010.1 43 kDa receptor-associated protein of the synapse [Lingula anatina]